MRAILPRRRRRRQGARRRGGRLDREIAELLDVSLRTVERDWGIARAWLRDRIRPAGEARAPPDRGDEPPA